MRRAGAAVLAALLSCAGAAASGGDASRAPAAGDAPILAGAAARPITPEVGGAAPPVTLAGYGAGRLAEGVDGALEARALVLQAGGGAVAVVALDLYGLAGADAERVAAAVRSSTPSLERGGVIVACTRNHSAPDATGAFVAAGAHVDLPWLGRVARASADAVAEAWRVRQPARLSFAGARLGRLLSDGRRPFRLDDRAALLRVEGAESRNGIASLALFSAIPETRGRSDRRIDPDYPGPAREALEAALGGTGLFLLGASGGRMLPAPPPGDADAGRALGETLARSLVVAWSERFDRPDPPPPDATRATLELRARTVSIPIENRRLAEALASGCRRPEGGGARSIAARIAVLRLSTGGAPLLDLACVPGAIYPELVDGGIQEPQDPASDLQGEPREAPLRDLLGAPVRLVAGACGGDLGDILPASEWDARPPFAYGQTAAPRGEETSPGPRTAAILLRAFADLMR